MSNEWNNYGGENENGEQDYAFQTLNRRGRPKTLGWSVASVVMGVISLFTSSFGWASIIFGVLAVMFSIVSRRILGYFDGKAIGGLILGIFGAVFGTAMIIFIYSIGADDEKYLWDLFKQMFETTENGGIGTDI